MQIESLPISSLAPDPRNARLHPQRNLDALKASLDRFGQQKPIVIDSASRVVAGHGTLAAAQALGWTKIYAVRTTLSCSTSGGGGGGGGDAEAYAIADNRTADLAQWDTNQLAQQLAILQNNENVDHLATGFTDDEIEQIINQATGLQPDPPEPQESQESPESPTDPNNPNPTPQSPGTPSLGPPQPIPDLYQLLVACDDEPSQRRLYDRLTAEGLPCRVLTL